MILFLFCLCVPAALFMWKLCAVGAAADAQMESAFLEMMRNRESVPRAEQEDVSAG